MSDQEEPIPTFLGSGWLYLQPEGEAKTQELRKQLQETDDKLNDDIRRTFSSPHGKRVFSWLWQRTIMQPTFMGHLGMERAVPMGFAREGQNSIVMELKQRIDKSHG